MKKSIMLAITLTVCLIVAGCALFNNGSDEITWCGEPAQSETAK